MHRVAVEGFWIDERPVTVGQFRRFVKDTGYVTLAERPPDPGALPGRRPGPARARRAGLPARRADRSTCPTSTTGGPTRLARAGRARRAPASDTYTRGRHPVTQIAYEDAEAYAAWAGKALPTEAEWEYAARGGLEGKAFAWGDELAPDGEMRANFWQGEFPWQNQMLDGYAGTSPVGAFPANGYGLYDMTGNVWEWTCDPFTATHERRVAVLRAARRRTRRSRAASSRAARTCARRTTACASGPPRARARPSTPPPATSASAASLEPAEPWPTRSGRCSRSAVGVSLSPVPIIAVVLMLGTPRARVNGPAFVLGWILGLAIVGAIVLAVAGGAGATTAASRRPGSTGSSCARRPAAARRGQAVARAPARGRRRAAAEVDADDRHVHARAPFGIAAAFSGMNPKNLLLTVGAAAAIAQAGHRHRRAGGGARRLHPRRHARAWPRRWRSTSRSASAPRRCSTS